MKKSIKVIKILFCIFGISSLIALCVCLLVLFIGSQYWQIGYTPFEWVEAGIQELEQNNKLNYDDYNIRFIKSRYEDDCFVFEFEVDFYIYDDRENEKDIDLWYGKKKTCIFSICLDSDCLYNRIVIGTTSDEGVIDICKFEKCLDYDIFVEEK